MKFSLKWFQNSVTRRRKQQVRRRSRRALVEQLETRELLANSIVSENLLPGSPASEWDIGQGIGDPAIQGFATEISVDQGETISFKINDTAAAPYSIDIYRIGYYQGNGARKVATIPASQTLVQSQPAPIYDAAIGLLDAGNWSVSASWSVPEDAVSGVYIARLRRTDNGDGSHIIFVVRDDDGASDLLFQTSDTTWQAYNRWGGSSFYAGPFNGRTYALSYNRPFDTRATTPKDWFFGPEYATVRWLEANGYDVSYTTGVDTARRGEEILEHNAFLSVGHDEYWSQEQRENVEAARDAGVNLAFFSGNEIYWKTRWQASDISASDDFRTLICYKETWDDAKIDPLPDVWTGTWRDPRFSPPADGGRPENELSGQIFTVNRGPGGNTGTPFEVPSDYAAMRFWRNTRVADLAPGEVASVGDRVLGYEWDEDLDNGFRPAGLVRMSSTTQLAPEKIDDYGRRNTGSGMATHSLTLYRAASGALVFGAGTINWGFGLDGVHDIIATTPDIALQQATVNLFAEMGVQPETLQSGLVAGTMSTDVIAPASTITSLASGAILPSGVAVVLAGTASDEGGVVGGVEVSTDGGISWHRAEGRESWTYAFTPSRIGPTTILTRAADDSGNIESPTGVNVTVQLSPTSNSGLVAAYSFNQGSGSTLTDSSGNNNHGSVSGANWVTGLAGNALSFDGVDDLVTIADANSLDLTTGMTLEAWVRPADRQGWSTVIAKERGGNNVGYVLYASAGTDEPPQGSIVTASDDIGARDRKLLPLNTWSHLVTTYDGAQLRLYVNGSLVSSTAVTGAINTSSNPLRIGGNTVFSDEYFRGLIDEVRIYNRSLNEAEIQYNISTPVGGSVDSVPPTGAVTTPSGTVSGTVSINVNATDNIAVAGVQVLLNGQPLGLEDTASPYQLAWNTATVPNGAYTLSARLRDFAGNIRTTTAVNVQVSNALDTAPPTLRLKYPQTGDIVSGTVLLAALGADNVGVAGVQFQIDGNNLGPEDTVAPYRVAWETSGVAGGAHIVSAIARDAAGNITSRTATVMVDDSVPTVTARTPSPGAVNVPADTVVTATFSEPMQPASLVFQLTDGAGTPVLAAVSYNAPTRTLTLDPQQDLQLGVTYTAQITSGRDLAGIPVVPVSWTFTTDGTVASASFWDTSVVPAITADTDTSAVELGVKFRSTAAGYITGLRFYKGLGNAGTHIGNLWSAAGTLLASVTFTNETSQGWQQANFSTPVAIAANTTYVASYFAPQGRYAANLNYFNNGLVSGPLVAPSSSSAGGNGVYRYGSASGFPTDTFNATNYWVDALFSSTLADVIAPTVTSRTPIPNATAVATGANLVATFNEPIQSSTAAFTLRDAANNIVPATVTYNAANYTLTLDPTSALADFTSYTAKLSGAKDQAGNQMTPLEWSFTTSGVDVIAPTIIATMPGAGATNVDPTQRITATFSEMIDLNSLQVTLTDDANQNIPVGVFYDSVTNTAYVNMIPEDGLPGGCCGACSHCPLLPSTTYTVRFSNAQDLSGNTMTPVTWSFTTAEPTTNVSIWNDQTLPTSASSSDTSAVELGVKFQTSTDGYITGLRFYKGAGNTGTHVGHIWSAAGSVLGSATFVDETASGWQQVTFGTPVFVTAGETYVASYFAPRGRYAFDDGYFNSGGVTNGPLRLLANSEGGNGVYRYGAGGGFPNQTYRASNYWVDVVFANTLSDTTAPTVASHTPAAGATNVAQNAALTATFSEAVQSSTVAFVLTNSGGAAVPATFSYDAATKTATLTPSAPLAAVATYTATISGAQDAAGNTMASVNWSFTTGGDVTAPTITSRSPTSGDSNVALNSPVTATFSEPIQSPTLSFTLTSSAGSVPATLSYNPTTRIATLTPAAALSMATTYTATISGAQDAAGNTMTSVTWSFTTVADAGAPTVISRTPAKDAKGVAINSSLTATFSEPVQSATIAFTLRDAGGGVVPATLTYDAATRTATLQPLANLASGAVYTATLSGAQDAAGNTLVTTSWSFKTLGQWRQSSTADFATGTHTGTAVTVDGDGAVSLAALTREEFPGPALGSNWTVSNWSGSGGASITGGVLGVSGSMVASAATYLDQAVEARVAFGAAPFLHFGLATGLNSVSGDSWAIFSTGSTSNTLFARVNVRGTQQDVSLGAIPSGLHTYRITPTGSGFAFAIDGVLRTTIGIAFTSGTPSRIAFSAYNTASPPRLTVDWVGNPTPASTGTYQSAVFDAGAGASWQSVQWSSQVPTGAGLQVEVSFSDNAQSGWTNWTPVTNGASLGGVVFRYARYRVTLSAAAELSPLLFDITLFWE